MRISLRKFLAVVAMAGAGLELPLGTLSIPAGRMAASASVRSPVIEPFVVPLPIPPVLEPKRTNSGVDYHEITGRVRKQEILLGLRGYARPILITVGAADVPAADAVKATRSMRGRKEVVQW